MQPGYCCFGSSFRCSSRRFGTIEFQQQCVQLRSLIRVRVEPRDPFAGHSLRLFVGHGVPKQLTIAVYQITFRFGSVVHSMQYFPQSVGRASRTPGRRAGTLPSIHCFSEDLLRLGQLASSQQRFTQVVFGGRNVLMIRGRFFANNSSVSRNSDSASANFDSRI